MDKSNYQNWLDTRTLVGWVPLAAATLDTWAGLGFKCGLEVHQQLLTRKKLFCRCKAGIFHDFELYDAEIVRHMRPTLSELGGYDGTALMEFKTRKKIVYRINNDSACTYEVDDTPPFPLNREALSHAMQIALLLKLNIVGELHITRKQYLDGSIPTGFQRTTILGIEGEFPISNKTIRVIQFSIEEDSCREVSDFRHTRVYYADRLGMPLIETVTYPDMLTPWEAAEAAQNIRFIARSSGKVRVGIGAAREDVNVSISGGTRVEIKGVAHISWIPKLTHNEAFRQKSLLKIMAILNERISDPAAWEISHSILDLEPGTPTAEGLLLLARVLKTTTGEDWKLVAVNLPGFEGILSYFNQPGHSFADEISDRLKVIACLEKPNMLHSEQVDFGEILPVQNLSSEEWDSIRKTLKAGKNDAQILFWTPDEDLKTALETISERGKMAFTGVPNETRKSLPDGTTIFERVLPGADRMYPDTDSAPIPILDEMIEEHKLGLPVGLSERLQQLINWKVPDDAYTYILRNNLMPVLEELSAQYALSPKYLALLYAHRLKSYQGCLPLPFDHQRMADLLLFVKKRKLQTDVLPAMLKVLYQHPNMQFASILSVLSYKEATLEEIKAEIPVLIELWEKVRKRGYKKPDALSNWIMGQLSKHALGNIPLAELYKIVAGVLQAEVSHA
ncbi:MAG: Glu-tRNA(Gln) amidotransferase subunit GatE [Candidatus Cloacimonas sp.]|jgi:glutamyl-tRNA(Gln) amidotransferase subunit E|nr:Glu-tRNA(Gln) amidotransferase subunit GatE [Candidatus Cloacimonas sp.]